MTTYKVISWNGSTTLISAFTESDAYQQAAEFCGDDGIKEFTEV
jgi:hypothetical protein